MSIIYNLLIKLYGIILYIASPFHTKARQMTQGRLNLFDQLSKKIENNIDPVVWVHCASLGEFEQGRPIIEKIKEKWPRVKICLTFYSPSGFEVRKNYPMADWIYYLPYDTAYNAQKFVALLAPKLAIFVKYEFWHNYTKALANKSIPIVSISSIFREGQPYFNTYFPFFKNILHRVDHFFVQNHTSGKLLETIGLINYTIAGDTRFDRVFEQSENDNSLPIIETFKKNQRLFVIGSAWAEDIQFLMPFLNNLPENLKIIIAPHQIKDTEISQWQNSFSSQSIRYSEILAKKEISDQKILIIDNIGLLGKIYSYANFAWIGGAFGAGLHNILEAATFGMPIFFGDKSYKKFQEALDLIDQEVAQSFNDYKVFELYLNKLLNDQVIYDTTCQKSKNYIKNNIGATNLIINYISKYL